MKVLFVAHSAELSGGANRSLLGVMKGLRDHWGISPSVLIPAANGELQKVCEAEAIPVYVGQYHTCCTVFRREMKDVFRFLKLFAAPVIDWLYAKKLNSELPEDIDVFYSNERMVVIGGYLARLRKKPHIWHVRSFAQENSTHYPPFYWRLMDRYAQRIILISGALFRSFSKHIDAQKLCMIHNGVELGSYCVDERIAHEGYRLLLTGRIVPPKGQLEAIKALEILNKENGRCFELYFAGDTPQYGADDYKKQLDDYIISAGLENHVHFLGDVKNIAQLRREMDLELVCSWCETFGRVTVEAMCAQIPVIGSNSGGTPEIIIDNQTGLLYTPHDANQLAQKILWCAEHPDEVKEMTERACRRAKEHFAIEVAVRRIFSVISEVAAEEQDSD